MRRDFQIKRRVKKTFLMQNGLGKTRIGLRLFLLFPLKL